MNAQAIINSLTSLASIAVAVIDPKDAKLVELGTQVIDTIQTTVAEITASGEEVDQADLEIELTDLQTHVEAHTNQVIEDLGGDAS